MGETRGTFVTLLGEVKGKSFLPRSFDEVGFWRQVETAVKGEGEIRVISGGGFEVKRPESNLYRGSWILERSDNLSRLYEKNNSLLSAT
jgi:NADH-quinone oxidoreductase subunit G